MNDEPKPAEETRLPVEAWVKAKGHYEKRGTRPYVHVTGDDAGKPIEAHFVASARVLHGWAIGTMLTEAEYDAGIEASSVQITHSTKAAD